MQIYKFINIESIDSSSFNSFVALSFENPCSLIPYILLLNESSLPSSYFVRKRSPAVPLHKSGGGRPGTYSSPLYTAAAPLLNCSCIIDSRVSELWASIERLGALSALSKSHFFAQQDWIMSSSVFDAFIRRKELFEQGLIFFNWIFRLIFVKT